MTLKNEPRREPSLADLEAFERLLRDSLKADGSEAAPAPAPAAPSQPAITADTAMAEFNRLVEAPVVFEQPGAPPSVSRISQIEQALRADLDKPPVPAPAPAPTPSAPRDPLLDFEEELRRFEAMSRPQTPANPVEPAEGLRGGYAGDAAPTAWAPQAQPIVVPAPAPAAAHDALAAAENRLNAEAEAAAYAGGAAMAAGAAGGAKRSRGIFFALGGVAVAGLAVIGGVTLFSGSKNQTVAGGKVPVIAAKSEPAKEKPANPGGLEVPDQNKQVLAARNTPSGDSRPAQVVNQTEQPVDLNQIARRDGVRVVAPSPFQQPPADVVTTSPSTALPGTTPAPAPGEPRRVQSIRIADPVAPPPAVTPSGTPGIGGGSIAGLAAGTASARPAPASPGIPAGAQAAIRPTPPVNPPPVVAPPPAPTPAAPASAPRDDGAPKVEARPQSPVTAPRPAPTATAPQRSTTNAPLPLGGGSRPAPAAPADGPAPAPTPRVATAPASGAFAIQLASRPTEADAQNAGRQLGQRFSGQIGGKSPVVVRGEANGQTVYRVRVTGFAQADATAACDRIRAAGGACFVTRQ